MKLLRYLFTDYNMSGLQAIGIGLGAVLTDNGHWIAGIVAVTVFSLLGTALNGGIKISIERDK